MKQKIKFEDWKIALQYFDKTASVTKSELSNADLLLFLNIEQGVETNGIE
jgi:hypothetical protein